MNITVVAYIAELTDILCKWSQAQKQCLKLISDPLFYMLFIHPQRKKTNIST